MKLLLDTHVFLGVIDRRIERFGAIIQWLSKQRDAELYLSVASLWEIAIKARLGKLDLPLEPSAFPELIERIGINLVAITSAHVLLPLDPEPGTRDPFDRLLLAQCQVEEFRLVTVDHALIDHPVAAKWR